MNLSYKIKQELINSSKPISDYKLIQEYIEDKSLTNQESLDFVNNYCKNNYPIQYIVGYEYFFKNKIYVNENVLIPRMETEEVVLNFVNEIKKKFDKNNLITILDLCTGPGTILIGTYYLLRENGFNNLKLYASDISKEALEVAKNNFNLNKLNVEIIKSDLLEYFIDNNMTFDCIISNPPYIAHNGDVDLNVKTYEPNLALFANDNGLELYKKIISQIDKIINDNNVVCFEIGFDQGNDLDTYASINSSFSENVIIKDMNNLDRTLLLKRNKYD